MSLRTDRARRRTLGRYSESTTLARRGRRGKTPQVSVTVRRAFVIGFVGALGALGAFALGDALGSISTILIYITAALFVALALDPLVSWLERRRIARPVGIAIVFTVFAAAVAGAIVLVIPTLVRQGSELVDAVPGYVANLQSEGWFVDLNTQLSGFVDLDKVLDAVQAFVSDPNNWLAVAGGVFRVGEGIANGVLGTVTVLILTLYFLASLDGMKQGAASLVPRSSRTGFLTVTDQIMDSVGGYVNGMIILAAINAVLGFIVMTIVGVPFAAPLALAVFALAIVPLVGSVLATVLVTVVALFNSPTTAVIILIYYLVYMQIEAYVMTPRIMNKAVSVPGALVVIGALAGGTMLGILGALIAVPVTASILIIVKQVVVPRQDAR
ncbi:AI-2E family transporter [Okibacterium endophyticum]